MTRGGAFAWPHAGQRPERVMVWRPQKPQRVGVPAIGRV
jgi:hypothetical protein